MLDWHFREELFMLTFYYECSRVLALGCPRLLSSLSHCHEPRQNQNHEQVAARRTHRCYIPLSELPPVQPFYAKARALVRIASLRYRQPLLFGQQECCGTSIGFYFSTCTSTKKLKDSWFFKQILNGTSTNSPGLNTPSEKFPTLGIVKVLPTPPGPP